MPTFIDCMLLKNVSLASLIPTTDCCVFSFQLLQNRLLFAGKSFCLSAAQKRDYAAYTFLRQHLSHSSFHFVAPLLFCPRKKNPAVGRDIYMSLNIFKLWRSLFQKGFHSFFLILRSERAVEHTALVLYTFRQCSFVRAIDGFFNHHHRRQ